MDKLCLKPFTFSRNGTTPEQAAAGQIVNVPAELVAGLVAEGFLAPDDPAAAADQTDPAADADQTDPPPQIDVESLLNDDADEEPEPPVETSAPAPRGGKAGRAAT